MLKHLRAASSTGLVEREKKQRETLLLHTHTHTHVCTLYLIHRRTYILRTLHRTNPWQLYRLKEQCASVPVSIMCWKMFELTNVTIYFRGYCKLSIAPPSLARLQPACINNPSEKTASTLHLSKPVCKETHQGSLNCDILGRKMSRSRCEDHPEVVAWVALDDLDFDWADALRQAGRMHQGPTGAMGEVAWSGHSEWTNDPCISNPFQ